MSPTMAPDPATVRALNIAARTASEINDELTTLLSALALIAPADAAAGMELTVIRSAAQRCAWKTSALLQYVTRHGGRAVNATAARLILEDACTQRRR